MEIELIALQALDAWKKLKSGMSFLNVGLYLYLF
jgi:hypothetical protein